MTPAQLSDLLARRAEAVARKLLPDGKRESHEWRCGSAGGERGKSLGVHLDGDRAGVWCDFATGEAGDLLDLWMAVHRVPLRQAMEEAAAFCGIELPKFDGHKAREYIRPQRPKCLPPQNAVKAYLNGRGITDEAIAAYKVGERGETIVFPFLRDGELIMAKARKVGEGEKPKPTENGCEKCLFGWQAIPDAARSVVITEGEIDAMSAYVLGAPGLSVPYGGGGGNKQDWVENDYPHLERFDTIYLALDMDEAGQQGTAEIIKRLGAERCRVVSLPCKDLNDYLTTGGTREGFAALLRNAKTQDPAELKRAAEYVEQIAAEIHAKQEEVGIPLPWKKCTALRIRYGEVILLGGVNGHGKSQFAGHITLGAVAKRVRSCVFSGEFKPHKWLARLTRQASAEGMPTLDQITDVSAWWSDWLFVFDVVGDAKVQRLLEVFGYAAKRYGVRFFVIDNLAKLGIDEDDYNGQKSFVARLTDFAKDYDCAVLLLAHMRKSSDEKHAGRKMGIKGSGALTDLVDTVITIHRNKDQEDRIKAGEISYESRPEPDAIVYCDKQRNGNEEPHYGFWFDPRCFQYLSAKEHTALPFYAQNTEQREAA